MPNVEAVHAGGHSLSIAVSSFFRHSGFVMRHLMRAAALALMVLLAACGCSKPPVELVEARLAMDTQVMVRAIGPTEAAAKAAIDAAWKEMDECAKRLDRHREDSDISRVNRSAGQWDQAVDPVVTSCLAAAREVYDLTDGAFDPTVGPILDLWRRAAERGKLPTDEEIAEARARVGMEKVEVMVLMIQKPAASPPDSPAPMPTGVAQPVHMVELRKEGMVLDLGGIAKGYIVGRMMRRIEQAGATAALIDAGGDVYAVGERPANLAGPTGDRRWAVGVQDPRYPDQRGRLYTAVRVRDLAVVTSGHYARGYEVAGQRFSHIVDPRTGRPVPTNLASVTVVAPDPALADGLATAIAVMGVQKGLDVVEKLDGVECLLLEQAPAGQAAGAEGATAEPAEPVLIAHRSPGFSSLEFSPSASQGTPARCPVCF